MELPLRFSYKENSHYLLIDGDLIYQVEYNMSHLIFHRQVRMYMMKFAANLLNHLTLVAFIAPAQFDCLIDS